MAIDIEKMQAELDELRENIKNGFLLLGINATCGDLYNTGFIPDFFSNQTIQKIVEQERKKLAEILNS